MSDQHSGSHPPTPTNGVDPGVSRRSFIKTVGVSAAVTATTTAVQSATAEIARDGETGVSSFGPDAVTVNLTVNGRSMRTEIDPSGTLLDALRWHFGLTGSKSVCDRGSCGACSVMVDGQLVCSCMMLAVDAIGTRVETIEGLANGDELDPVQEAFIRHDALQCGFCTPGLVLAARCLLNENPKPTMQEIKAGLSGNLCRCGTYSNVFNAVLDASGQKIEIEKRGGGS